MEDSSNKSVFLNYFITILCAIIIIATINTFVKVNEIHDKIVNNENIDSTYKLTDVNGILIDEDDYSQSDSVSMPVVK